MIRKIPFYICLIASMFVSGCVIQPVNSTQSSVDFSAPIVSADSNKPVTTIGAYRLKPLDPVFIRFSGILEQQVLELGIDENGEIVKFKRTYGYSYPIIYNCSGENAFQGCSKRSMVDYVLEYDDGTITISSSDDWIKIDN